MQRGCKFRGKINAKLPRVETLTQAENTDGRKLELTIPKEGGWNKHTALSESHPFFWIFKQKICGHLEVSLFSENNKTFLEKYFRLSEFITSFPVVDF